MLLANCRFYEQLHLPVDFVYASFAHLSAPLRICQQRTAYGYQVQLLRGKAAGQQFQARRVRGRLFPDDKRATGKHLYPTGKAQSITMERRTYAGIFDSKDIHPGIAERDQELP